VRERVSYSSIFERFLTSIEFLTTTIHRPGCEFSLLYVNDSSDSTWCRSIPTSTKNGRTDVSAGSPSSEFAVSRFQSLDGHQLRLTYCTLYYQGLFLGGQRTSGAEVRDQNGRRGLGTRRESSIRKRPRTDNTSLTLEQSWLVKRYQTS
jgi:hypothetical protein